MKLKVDGEADALYLRLDDSKIVESEEVSPGVVLDFNEAYNPPCAFNRYTTCPLPPPGNRIAARIPAGEKAYRGGH